MSVVDSLPEATAGLHEWPEPSDGLVLRWRRRGHVWEGLVTREVDGHIVTAWEPALVM